MVERGKYNGCGPWRTDLESDLTVANQKELVGRPALAKEVFADLVAVVAGTSGHQLAMLGCKAREERMFGQDRLKTLHALLPSRRLG